MLQVKKFPTYPSPLERNHESTSLIQRSAVSASYLERRDLSLRGRERIPGVPVASQEEALSRGKARGTPGSCHHSQNPPNVSVHLGKPVFPALPRLSSRGSTHTTVARRTALWESLVGKPRGKASRESHRSLDPLDGKRDTAARPGEESARACPHSRRTLTPLGRPQKYPKIHVSPGEESSGSATDSTQSLRPRHRWERNPETPPSNSHGYWSFLRPPERVPEVPVVSREHLPQLENIQEFLPSRRNEAHFR